MKAAMPFPMKTCAVCGEEFELRPDKPGFANRCPECTADEMEAAAEAAKKSGTSADERKEKAEMDAARRETIRNMLYRKDS
jgi:hypothetical protein